MSNPRQMVALLPFRDPEDAGKEMAGKASRRFGVFFTMGMVWDVNWPIRRSFRVLMRSVWD